jgi:hypothetical protein
MKAARWLLVAAALTFVAGCARGDWIDRTLVTVDVTGTWYGRSGGPGSDREVFLELKQEGSRVTGFARYTPYGSGVRPIDGAVAGDVFRFRGTTGSIEGELTVSGDEMNGQASFVGRGPISLRRVDPSSRPDSPRR